MGPSVRNKAGQIIRAYAHFPQGPDSMQRYLKYHQIYPENAWNNNIQGTVTCQFIVNKDGMISDVRILKGVSLDIDSEAIRLVLSLPRFIPTTFNNKPQITSSVLHIPFVKPMICKDPDRPAEFPGGTPALMAYMKKMPYPKNTGNIIGKMAFNLIVADDGSVIYATTDKSFGVQYQSEIRKFFRAFPRLRPGYKNGEPVCTELDIPLNITTRH